MREKIKNALSVEVTGTDLTKATKLQFWLRQGALFFEYVPAVVDETHLLVTIPLADGNPQAADIVSQPVKELLKEAGYA